MSLEIKCACGAEFKRSDSAVSTIVTEKRWVRIHQGHGDRTALLRLTVELEQAKAALAETQQLLADSRHWLQEARKVLQVAEAKS